MQNLTKHLISEILYITTFSDQDILHIYFLWENKQNLHFKNLYELILAVFIQNISSQ